MAKWSTESWSEAQERNNNILELQVRVAFPQQSQRLSILRDRKAQSRPTKNASDPRSKEMCPWRILITEEHPTSQWCRLANERALQLYDFITRNGSLAAMTMRMIGSHDDTITAGHETDDHKARWISRGIHSEVSFQSDGPTSIGQRKFQSQVRQTGLKRCSTGNQW